MTPPARTPTRDYLPWWLSAPLLAVDPSPRDVAYAWVASNFPDAAADVRLEFAERLEGLLRDFAESLRADYDDELEGERDAAFDRGRKEAEDEARLDAEKRSKDYDEAQAALDEAKDRCADLAKEVDELRGKVALLEAGVRS